MMELKTEGKKRNEFYKESEESVPEESDESPQEYWSELLRLVSEMAAQHSGVDVEVVELKGHPPDSNAVRTVTDGEVIMIDDLRFVPGTAQITEGALSALEESAQSPAVFLRRHLAGDWGELCEEDSKANEQALRRGGMLLSHYRTAKGERLYIYTSADRTRTIVMKPEEY